MAVELLERQEKETQSSNYVERSYNDACDRDSQDMDENVQSVVKQYTSNADDINRHERKRFRSLAASNGEKDKITYKDPVPIEESCNVLDEYLGAGRLNSDFHLFRGTSLENLCNSVVFSQIDNSDFLKDCKEIEDGNKLTEKYKGQIFTYIQLVSTSIKTYVAADFLCGPTQCMLNINAPKGACARCLGDNSSHRGEYEVLLASGTQFRIVRIEHRQKMKDIYVEVIV